MASLTGSSVATTYDQLLTLPSGGGNTTTLVALTDGDGVNTFCLQLATTSALIVDDAKLYFGTGSDASFEYDEDGNDVLLYDGANFRIEDDTQLQFGAAADWTVEYDEDGDDDLVFTGSDMAIESSTSAKPLVIIKNTTNDTTAPTLRFVMDKGAAGADDDDIGTISFYSDNSAQEQTAFASIVAEVSEADDTDEAGKLSFFVSESNGTTAQLTAGLILEGEHATDGEVDVTIGAGASSTTTIAGNLVVTGSGAGISHDGSTANGVLTYKDADEATVESNLTFDGTDLLIGGTGKLYLSDAGGEWIYGNGTNLYLSAGNATTVSCGAVFAVDIATGKITWDGAEFYPENDDEELLGHVSYHWNELYCENATINTSDEREKENIEDSSLGLSFLNQLRAVQYKRKDRTVPEVLYEEVDDIPEGKEIGDVKTEAREKTYLRTHYGLIAQEVEQVLENNNIDSIDFAPFIKSPVLDGDGINGEPTGEHRYGMRYAEYVGILIKAVQELSAKNDELSAKVTALENA